MSQLDEAIKAIKQLFSQRDDVLLEFKRDRKLFLAANAFKLAIVEFERREQKLEEIKKKEAEERVHQFEQNEPKKVNAENDESFSHVIQLISPRRAKIAVKPEITVSNFASEIGIQLDVLLKQFASAGVEKLEPDDIVSEKHKVSLRDFLSKTHGSTSTKEDCKKNEILADNSPRNVAKNEKPASPTTACLSAMENYEWPSRAGTKPYIHQIKTTEFLVKNNNAFCLNDMGTGKTLSVLWAYDYLRQLGKVKSMLIICPLSTMVSTWQNEIHKHFNLGSKLLHGMDGAARRKALDQKAHIYIINHDGLKVPGMLNALIARSDIDIVVIDEIAAFRNAGTDRWKALRKITDARNYLWGLTGTPIPNTPIDAWAQCRLISPHLVPTYLGKFRELVTLQVNSHQWVPRENALEVVAEAMQPSIRFKRDECIDLPPVVYEIHKVELTDEQKVAYKQLLLQLRTEISGKIITAVNARVMANKLLQIACGAVIAEATGKDKVAFIPAKERLNLVKEIIEDAGGSVIVFVPFRGVLNYVVEYLKIHFSVAAIHGGVPNNERVRIFDEFQNKKTVRVLVSIPHAMSHGLNLTAANTIIWFGPIYSNDVYQQANARISRPGQVRKQLIVNIEGTKAEELIYKKLRERQHMQDLLLEILKEGLSE